MKNASLFILTLTFLLAAAPASAILAGNQFLTEILLSKAYELPLEISRLRAKSGEGLFDWKVGDTLNFEMQLKPLPTKGTMVVKVISDTSEGYTLEEDVDVSVMKQNVQVLFDKYTGEIKKMTVNGKETDIPGTGGEKLVKEEEAHITVAAGSYDCIHMVTEDAEHQQSQTWLNPAAIPITGILKTKSEQSGILEVDTELVSFARGQ